MGSPIPSVVRLPRCSLRLSLGAARGGPGFSGKERERLDVLWPDDGEVSVVKRRNFRPTEPLRRRDHGRVYSAEREIRVLLDELRHALEIRGCRRLEPKLPSGPEGLRTRYDASTVTPRSAAAAAAQEAMSSGRLTVTLTMLIA